MFETRKRENAIYTAQRIPMVDMVDMKQVIFQEAGEVQVGWVSIATSHLHILGSI